MSMQEFDEFERDEEMLEQRRLKRLEMKRKRKIQQRIILGVLAVVVILLVVLLVKGCSSSKPEEKPQEDIVQPEPVPEEVVQKAPDVIATLAAVGDIMMYDSQIAAGQQEDQTYDFTSCFEAIYPYTASADLTLGNLELNMLGKGP